MEKFNFFNQILDIFDLVSSNNYFNKFKDINIKKFKINENLFFTTRDEMKNYNIFKNQSNFLMSEIITNCMDLYSAKFIDESLLLSINLYYTDNEILNDILMKYYLTENVDFFISSLEKNQCLIKELYKTVNFYYQNASFFFLIKNLETNILDYDYNLDHMFKSVNDNNILNNIKSTLILNKNNNYNYKLHNNLIYINYKIPDYNKYNEDINHNLISLHFYQMYYLYTAEYNFKLIMNFFNNFAPYLHLRLPINYTIGNMLLPTSHLLNNTIDNNLNGLLFDELCLTINKDQKSFDQVLYIKKPLNTVPTFYKYKYKNEIFFNYFYYHKNDYKNYVNSLDLDLLYNQYRPRTPGRAPYDLRVSHFIDMLVERFELINRYKRYIVERGYFIEMMVDSSRVTDFLMAHPFHFSDLRYDLLEFTNNNKVLPNFFPFMKLNLFDKNMYSKKIFMNSAKPEDQLYMVHIPEPNREHLMKSEAYIDLDIEPSNRKIHIPSEPIKDSYLFKYSKRNIGRSFMRVRKPIKLPLYQSFGRFILLNFNSNIGRNARIDMSLKYKDNLDLTIYPGGATVGPNVLTHYFKKINNKKFNKNIIRYTLLTLDNKFYEKTREIDWRNHDHRLQIHGFDSKFYNIKVRKLRAKHSFSTNVIFFFKHYSFRMCNDFTYKLEYEPIKKLVSFLLIGFKNPINGKFSINFPRRFYNIEAFMAYRVKPLILYKSYNIFNLKSLSTPYFFFNEPVTNYFNEIHDYEIVKAIRRLKIVNNKKVQGYLFDLDVNTTPIIMNIKANSYPHLNYQQEQQFIISQPFTNKFLQNNNINFLDRLKNRLYFIDLMLNFDESKRNELNYFLLQAFMKQKLKTAFFLHNPFSYRAYKAHSSLSGKGFLKILDYKPFFIYRYKLYHYPKNFNFSISEDINRYQGKKSNYKFFNNHIYQKNFEIPFAKDFILKPLKITDYYTNLKFKNYKKLPLFDRKLYLNNNAINPNSDSIVGYIFKSNYKRNIFIENSSNIKLKTDSIYFFCRNYFYFERPKSINKFVKKYLDNILKYHYSKINLIKQGWDPYKFTAKEFYIYYDLESLMHSNKHYEFSNNVFNNVLPNKSFYHLSKAILLTDKKISYIISKPFDMVRKLSYGHYFLSNLMEFYKNLNLKTFNTYYFDEKNYPQDYYSLNKITKRLLNDDLYSDFYNTIYGRKTSIYAKVYRQMPESYKRITRTFTWNVITLRLFDVKNFHFPYLRNRMNDSYIMLGMNPIRFHKPISEHLEKKLLYFSFFGYLINNNLIFGPLLYRNINILAKNIEYDFFQADTKTAIPFQIDQVNASFLTINNKYSWIYLKYISNIIKQHIHEKLWFRTMKTPFKVLDEYPLLRYQIFFPFDIEEYFIDLGFSCISYAMMFYKITFNWLFFCAESIIHLEDWVNFSYLIDWELLADKYQICPIDLFGKNSFEMSLARFYFTSYSYGFFLTYFYLLKRYIYPPIKFIYKVDLFNIFYKKILANLIYFFKKDQNYKIIHKFNKSTSVFKYIKNNNEELIRFEDHFELYTSFLEEYRKKYVKYSTKSTYNLRFTGSSKGLTKKKIFLNFPFILDSYSKARIKKLKLIVNFQINDLYTRYESKKYKSVDYNYAKPYFFKMVNLSGHNFTFYEARGRFNQLIFLYHEMSNAIYDYNKHRELNFINKLYYNSFLKVYVFSPLSEKNNYIYIPDKNLEYILKQKTYYYVNNFGFNLVLTILLYKYFISSNYIHFNDINNFFIVTQNDKIFSNIS